MIEKFWPQGRNEGRDVEEEGEDAEEAGAAEVNDVLEVDSGREGDEIVEEALSDDSVPGPPESADLVLQKRLTRSYRKLYFLTGFTG